MKVTHEYVITKRHRPTFQSALEGLLEALEAHGENNVRPFDFCWNSGQLLVKEELFRDDDDIFDDAPSYRVTPGLNWRIIHNAVTELLKAPTEIAKIQSLAWEGEQHQHNIVNLHMLMIVESSVPAVWEESEGGVRRPGVIDVSNPRSVSPLAEWDNVRVGAILSARYRLRTSRDGPLTGIAHLFQDGVRFCIVHQTFDSERLILYSFSSGGVGMFRVLDPATGTDATPAAVNWQPQSCPGSRTRMKLKRCRYRRQKNSHHRRPKNVRRRPKKVRFVCSPWWCVLFLAVIVFRFVK